MTSSPSKNVTFDNTINGGDNNDFSNKKHIYSAANEDDFSSSSVPTWARRGISWRSVREVFDEDFIPDDEKTEDLLELEMKHLDETMSKYAMLYNIVGLNYLDQVCADVEPENRLFVHRQIHEQLTREMASRKQLLHNHDQATEQDKNNNNNNKNSGEGSSARTASVAFCFNCRESGHTHGVCSKPRRCYICHDPRHDAFVCIANPVLGSEFYDPDEKCAICGDRGHMSVRCKSRGGPWQGKPGYAHLPDTTYPRPVVIHTGGRKAGENSDAANNNSSPYNKQLSILSSQSQQQQQHAPGGVNDSKSAREVIIRLAQVYRKKDLGLMKLMREAELFCGSLSMLADENLTVAQRSSLRQALDFLRPSVAGVDLTTFGVVLNPKNQGVIGSKKPKTSAGSNNVLDDEAALNELRTSSIDFNVVFGSHIERYSRSESSAEFRVGLQRIQARTGLKPSDINLYDDDEVAARINKQVMLAAEAARKAQARTLQLQREIERSQGGAGGGSSVSGLSSSRATSASSSHGTSSPTNNANNNTNKSSRRRTGKPRHSAPTTDEASHHFHQNQQNTPTEVKTPLGKMKGSKPTAAAATTTTIAIEKPSTNIFKGTGLRHISTLDPVAAERRARGRREAAGEATLMRWTRLLSRGRDVTQVTSQEATSSSNTMSLSKQTLRARAEEDLLRLMRAAVNKKGDASVIEGKKLKIPRVQHGTIGRDSIIRAWAEHKITPIDEVSPAASARTNNPSPPTRQHSTNNNNSNSKGMATRSSSYENEDDYDEDEDGENKAMKKSSGFHHHHRKSFRNNGDSSAGMNQRSNSGFFESGNNHNNERPHVSSKFSSSWGDLWSVPKNNNNDENNNNNAEMSPVRRLGSSMRRSNSSSPLKFGHDENNNGLEAILNLSPKPSFRNSPTNSPTSKQKREQHSGSKSPKSPKKDNNNTPKLRRRQITVQIKDSPSTVLKSPPLSPTAINNAQSIRSASSPFENRSPKSKRRPSSSQLLMNRRPSSSGLGLSLQREQSGSGVFSLESSSMNNNNNKEHEQEKIAKAEHSRQIATPRSNYRNDQDKLDCDIRLPKREEGKNGEEAEEPIRNWNAHRVAMTWGKQQENGGLHKNNRGDKVDVWLMAKDRYNKSVDEAKSLRDQKIEWGTRREESVAAKNDFDAFMLKLGNPPPIAKVIDPDVVNKWRGRFQTARIKAGVKDAAIKESRLVHRSVVATARLGGAAVCDGATKRAERWLRSHRDVETAVEGSGSSSALLSEHSSMWTILCHRIAIAAVRVRAKKELAEQLREFLARLPHGRATQDESIRMVYLFEEMVYGDEISEQVKQRREEETKKAEKNACFADLMMMKAFPHFSDSNNAKRFSGEGEGSMNNNKHSASMSSSSSAMKPKTTLDRCMEEWLLGNKRDDENKKKRLQASGGGGDDADGVDASKNATPHYAQAKDIDAQVRKANKDDLESQRKKDFYSIQQQRDMIQRQHQILEETHKRGSSSNNNTPSPLLLNIPHTTSRPSSMATLANAKNGRNFGSLTAMSSRPHSAATMSSATPQGSTALASPTGIQHQQGSPTFGSLIFSMSSSDDILILQQQQHQQNNGKSAAAFGSQRPSDLERLLSAPVTAQDLEKLIEKACRESYASLHDSDEWKRALPSNTKIWAKDDPRRLMPRTQEGESVASFLRWIVSPAATEGALGRVISKFTTQAGLFDFDLAFKEINPAARVVPAVSAPAQNEDEEGYLSIKNNENGAKGTGSAIQNAAAVLIVGNSGRAAENEATNNTMMPHPPSAKSSNFQRRDSSKVLTRDQNSGELLGSKQNTRKNVGQITILSVESSPNASGALNIPR